MTRHVWTNSEEWVVAADLDEIREVMTDLGTHEDDLNSWEWKQLDDAKLLKIMTEDSTDDFEIKTAAEWAALEGGAARYLAGPV